MCTFLKKITDLLVRSLVEMTDICKEDVHPNIWNKAIIKFLKKEIKSAEIFQN